MIRMVFVLILLCALAPGCATGQGAPQIKCQIGTTAWCIATFDGAISMQDAGEDRIWALKARTAHSNSSMKIVETKACSDTADESLYLVKSDKDEVIASATQVAEYVLNSNGCRLRFEIPQGESAATYRQVMLYGILVGSQKRTQLYKASKAGV